MYPVPGGTSPDLHRGLPVLDDFTGKLALAHATLAGFCHLFRDAPLATRSGALGLKNLTESVMLSDFKGLSV